MTTDNEYPRDHSTLRRESTRDPVFLLQERIAVWSENMPSGMAYDHNVESFVDGEGIEMTDADAIDAGAGVWKWSTITVFLTRSEGEDWSAARSYRYPHGTRVYCVPAEGAMCDVLANATIGGRYS